MSGPTARARGLLARGGWIDIAAPDGSYALRIGGDRRARAAMTLNEATFRVLVESPGLKARTGGGWVERPTSADTVSHPAGALGRIEGEPDGCVVEGVEVGDSLGPVDGDVLGGLDGAVDGWAVEGAAVGDSLGLADGGVLG